jgi:hypothetical protein
MRPWFENTTPTTGSWAVPSSDSPPTPSVASATEPSMPAFQPPRSRTFFSAASVMNRIATASACRPGCKPFEARAMLT